MQLVEELPDANPFLERFYAEPGRSALATQLRFLLEPIPPAAGPWPTARDGRGVVADYLFAKDQIFAEMNLEGPELGLYREVLGLMTDPIPTPDLVIYLEARPEVLMRRLRKRNREFERRISRGVSRRTRSKRTDDSSTSTPKHRFWSSTARPSTSSSREVISRT